MVTAAQEEEELRGQEKQRCTVLRTTSTWLTYATDGPGALI